MEFLKKMPRGPIQHHRDWLFHSGVEKTRSQAHEHFILCLILELGLLFDFLQVQNLMSFEIIARRIQLIESAFEQSQTGAPDFSAAEEFMSLQASSTGSAVTRTLQEHVAKEMREKSAIAKERRKAAEGLFPRLRNIVAPKAKAKGNGKGSPPAAASAAVVSP